MTEDHEDRYIPSDIDAEIEDIPEHHVPPELIAAIKKQVLQELQDEDKRKETEDAVRHAEQKKRHEKYIELMKASPDPWVEIVGWSETDRGVRVELDWNDAFITLLRNQGIPGAGDDELVQKWIILLMRDLAGEEQEEGSEGEFE